MEEAQDLKKRAARVRVASVLAVLGSRRGTVTTVALLAAGGGAYAYYVQEAQRSQRRKQPTRCAWPWMQCEPALTVHCRSAPPVEGVSVLQQIPPPPINCDGWSGVCCSLLTSSAGLLFLYQAAGTGYTAR